MSDTCTQQTPLGQEIDFDKHPDAIMLAPRPGFFFDKWQCPHCHRSWSGDAIDIMKQQKEQE